MNEKLYECNISMTYNAKTPEEAVKYFLSSIDIAHWYVDVKDVDSKEEFVVDTQEWITETKQNFENDK